MNPRSVWCKDVIRQTLPGTLCIRVINSEEEVVQELEMLLWDSALRR